MQETEARGRDFKEKGFDIWEPKKLDKKKKTGAQ